MAVEQEFEIGNDGGVEAPVESLPTQESKRAISLAKIRSMVEDPDIPVAEISRLIGLEILDLVSDMTTEDPLRRGARSQKDLNDQVKAFRELQKTLTESAILSKKDTLNMDGPKFQHVFSEIMRWFQTAMEDVKIEPTVSKNVMKHFGETARRQEVELRKYLNKLDSPGR